MKNNNDLTIIVIVALFILFFSGFGMMGFGGMGGMMGMFNYGFNSIMFGWLFMPLIIVALVLFIVWIVKQLQENKK